MDRENMGFLLGLLVTVASLYLRKQISRVGSRLNMGARLANHTLVLPEVLALSRGPNH